jgi:iron complex outermembrane receptor protein
MADETLLPALEVRERAMVQALNSLLGERLTTLEAPVDMSLIGATELAEPGTQSLSSALRRAADIGENYAISGYYQNFTLRGFTLDLGSAYRINGFVVPAEFDIPLDNVDAIEILKGSAGLHGGQVSAAGAINFVTRRAADVDSLVGELDARGGSRLTADIGRAIVGDTGIGFRLVAMHGEMHPAQPQADGRRDLISLGLDVRPGEKLKILADIAAQQRSQRAVPGMQLLGGTTLPDNDVRDLNINRQAWSRPVENRGITASLRGEWQVGENFRLEGGFAHTEAHIEDNMATPWGCNSAPYQYFCANGDYVLYKYHASERRTTEHTTLAAHLRAETGALTHALSAGVEYIDRRIRQNDVYSSTSYDAFGYALSGNLASTALPLADPGGVGQDRAPVKATQAAIYVADRVTWGDFRLLAALRSVEITQQPATIRDNRLLPQFALNWQYAADRQVYISQGRGLDFGSEAPLTAANAGTLLAPRLTRQIETGWKGRSQAGYTWSTALFRMTRPYEYTQPVGTSWAGLGNYVQNGKQIHRGINFNWQTPEQFAFRLAGNQTLLRATASGSAYDSLQIQNVPRFSSFLRANQRIPWVSGLDAHIDWIYRGQRNARRDGSVSVPGYSIFDFGLDWRQRLAGHGVQWALTVRNLTNRRYWRDVGEAYSADLLLPGEPRSLTASVRFDL